ncbi:MAG TPA: FAD-dependent oxidoreductase [Candidatus Omnitrophota bacterium]|nr:FAD-dependent oxidoreductase [Candidatus Omnitrophota bacterium]
MTDTDFDVIIIGGGVIGLSAAYYSAFSGKRTLLLEKNDFFHDLGSSGGNSRFFRVMYSDPKLARLSETSYSLWKQVEKETGISVLNEQPLLFYGSRNVKDTVEGDFNNSDQVMRKMGIPFKFLNSAEIQRHYSVFKKLPEEFVGLIQENSAVIQARNALRAFHHLAKNAGANLMTNSPASICDVSDSGKIITIKTPTGLYRTSSLILAPGVWTNEIIAPLKVQFDLTIWQMTVGYYGVENPNLNYPFWYEFGESAVAGQGLYYGFPVGTDYEGCIKASCDFTFNQYDKVQSCSRMVDPKALEMISTHLVRRFHGINPSPMHSSTCMYTMSKDYRMILGLLPGYKNIAILTGESGRAFKYAPIFGRIFNSLVSDGDPMYDIDCISINRPNIFNSFKQDVKQYE